ncbi:MAG TPA: hypothetical protein VGS27_34985 [Candidatus Sulfotelmatobacter sp.]|nr:hypothetical protein [Candidatus Sulfotelmatobacter sp.]
MATGTADRHCTAGVISRQAVTCLGGFGLANTAAYGGFNFTDLVAPDASACPDPKWMPRYYSSPGHLQYLATPYAQMLGKSVRINEALRLVK